MYFGKLDLGSLNETRDWGKVSTFFDKDRDRKYERDKNIYSAVIEGSTDTR